MRFTVGVGMSVCVCDTNNYIYKDYIKKQQIELQIALLASSILDACLYECVLRDGSCLNEAQSRDELKLYIGVFVQKLYSLIYIYTSLITSILD